MAKRSSFEDLVVWQEAMTLVEEVYRVTRHFPEEERFGLCSQLRRAAVSIPSNIAEGSERKQRRVFIHFLRVSMGSTAEVSVQLEIARRLRLVPEHDHHSLATRSNAIGRMLNGLVAALKRQDLSN